MLNDINSFVADWMATSPAGVDFMLAGDLYRDNLFYKSSRITQLEYYVVNDPNKSELLSRLIESLDGDLTPKLARRFNCRVTFDKASLPVSWTFESRDSSKHVLTGSATGEMPVITLFFCPYPVIDPPIFINKHGILYRFVSMEDHVENVILSLLLEPHSFLSKVIRVFKLASWLRSDSPSRMQEKLRRLSIPISKLNEGLLRLEEFIVDLMTPVDSDEEYDLRILDPILEKQLLELGNPYDVVSGVQIYISKLLEEMSIPPIDEPDRKRAKTKRIRMKSWQWVSELHKFAELGKTIWTVAELASLGVLKMDSARVAITRLVNMGILIKCAHGLYCLPGKEDALQLVRLLCSDGYITGKYALSDYKVISGYKGCIDVFCLGRHGTSRIIDSSNWEVRFFTVKREIWDMPSSPDQLPPAEQCLLDAIYLYRCDGQRYEELEYDYHFTPSDLCNPEDLNREILQQLLPRYPNTVKQEVDKLLNPTFMEKDIEETNSSY